MTVCITKISQLPSIGCSFVQPWVFLQIIHLIKHLKSLGIEALYLSPIFKALSHGYDIIDFNTIDPRLGGSAQFEALCQRLQEEGLKVILDIVPNHMAVSDQNPWWKKPGYEDFFDIDPKTGIYRRFFDLDELIALKQENQEVFEATHKLVFELIKKGLVQGLRIDHIDGLAEPAQYLQKLPDQLYVVLEKILQPGEALERDYKAFGTVGYDYLADLRALFVDSQNRKAFDQIYLDYLNDECSFENFSKSKGINTDANKVDLHALKKHFFVKPSKWRTRSVGR